MATDRASQLVEAGLCLQLSGDLEGAVKVWQEALRLDPKNARARSCLDAVNKAAFATPQPVAQAGSPSTGDFAPLGVPLGGSKIPTPLPKNPFAAPKQPGPVAFTPTPFATPVPVPQSGKHGSETDVMGIHTPVPAPRDNLWQAATTASPVRQGGPTTTDLFGPPTAPGRPNPFAKPPPPPPGAGDGPLPTGVVSAEAVRQALAGTPHASPPSPPQAEHGFAFESPAPTPPPVAFAPPEPVPVARPVAPPPPPSPEQQVVSLLNTARDLLALDDHTGAHDVIERALQLAPENAEAKAMLERSQATLLAMYESKLGDFQHKPAVLMRADEIVWLNIDHRAGFVLSMIDGTVSYDDLFSLSSMPRLDTAKVLVQLLQERVIA